MSGEPPPRPSGALAQLRELAQGTPAHRERHADLLRAVAITAVVAGHWLAVVIVYEDGQLGGFSALEALPWSHPLTWLFQVMPLFFLVGGYANAASRLARRRRGGDDIGWLLGRSGRLLPPTTALLVVLSAGALLARGVGVDSHLIGTAVWLACVPLWFLVAYLAVVVLTPVMHRLHQRAGLAVPAVLVSVVAAGDGARLIFHLPRLAEANYLLAWLAIHQLGFAWHDGRLPARPVVAVPLAAGGLAALVLLVTLGPYPVSMVNVPGAPVQNTSPPSLALLALATAQTGVALLTRNRSERWLRRTGPWTVVIMVNAVILTVFLWHMTAVLVASVALYPTGLFPQPPAGTVAWLLWRIPWLAVLAALLAVLVAVFGRIEIRGGRPARDRTSPPPARAARWVRPMATLIGFTAVVFGLLGVAGAGPGDRGPLGQPATALLPYFVGVGVLWLARRHLPALPGRQQSRPPSVPV